MNEVVVGVFDFISGSICCRVESVGIPVFFLYFYMERRGLSHDDSMPIMSTKRSGLDSTNRHVLVAYVIVFLPDFSLSLLKSLILSAASSPYTAFVRFSHR